MIDACFVLVRLLVHFSFCLVVGVGAASAGAAAAM
jgi:hypothetical protein